MSSLGGQIISGTKVKTRTLVVDSTRSDALVVRQVGGGSNVFVVDTDGKSATVTGDLTVTGTITGSSSISSTTDNLVEYASGNAADVTDFGWFGKYVSSGTKYAGMFRDADDSGVFKLFKDHTTSPGTTLTGFTLADMQISSLLASGTLSRFGSTSTASTHNVYIMSPSANSGQLVFYDGAEAGYVNYNHSTNALGFGTNATEITYM